MILDIQVQVRAPGEVTHVQPQGLVLPVASSHATGLILVLASYGSAHTSASCGRVFFLPPVLWYLCQLSKEMPIAWHWLEITDLVFARNLQVVLRNQV